MLNTLSDHVYSVRSTDVACCCEFNILDLELFLHPVKMVITRLLKCNLTAVHDPVDGKSP
jgi:hypothetical protein